ncbi:MAG: dihydrolipoamide acetyltransferase family protein [Phycisphaerales bacterium JB037]
MPIEITMPRLSDTMEAGTVVSWNVKVGDKVSVGDALADIETDKATMELEAFDDGTVAAIPAEEGKQVSVGSVIMILAAEGESVEDAAASVASGSAGKSESKSKSKSESESGSDSNGSSGSTATATESKPARSSGSSSPAPSNGSANGQSTNSGGNGRIFVSPLARKIADEAGLDLSTIDGSGPSGRIIKKDVEQAISRGGTRAASAPKRDRAAPSLPPIDAALEARTVPLSNMRATIAKRLVESKQTVPHYQVTVDAHLDALLALRQQLNDQLASQGVKLSVNDFLVRACALAMHQHPFVNASWGADGKSVDIHGEVNIGVAIALPIKEDLTGGGLVVGTLRDADRIGLRQISAETKRLATKAREKGLTIDEMSDSSFTISNLGMFGVSHFTAIINPPNAAILAVGAAEERPVVRDGQIVVGHVMSMTMSSDHRIIDGAMAAQYLQTVKQYLENPATLLV